MVLDTSLLNTRHYKVRIKGKVEPFKERSSTPALHLGVVTIEKGSFGSSSNTVANFTYYSFKAIISKVGDRMVSSNHFLSSCNASTQVFLCNSNNIQIDRGFSLFWPCVKCNPILVLGLSHAKSSSYCYIIEIKLWWACSIFGWYLRLMCKTKQNFVNHKNQVKNKNSVTYVTVFMFSFSSYLFNFFCFIHNYVHTYKCWTK